MPRNLDLNAARAARAEARVGVEPVTITVGEDVYVLPAEMPIAFLERAGALQDAITSKSIEEQAKAAGIIVDVVEALVGVDVYRALVDKHGLTFDDLRLIVVDVGGEYGLSLGESSASAASSDADGTLSRPTSSATTAPTSETPSPAATE